MPHTAHILLRLHGVAGQPGYRRDGAVLHLVLVEADNLHGYDALFAHIDQFDMAQGITILVGARFLRSEDLFPAIADYGQPLGVTVRIALDRCTRRIPVVQEVAFLPRPGRNLAGIIVQGRYRRQEVIAIPEADVIAARGAAVLRCDGLVGADGCKAARPASEFILRAGRRGTQRRGDSATLHRVHGVMRVEDFLNVEDRSIPVVEGDRPDLVGRELGCDGVVLADPVHGHRIRPFPENVSNAVLRRLCRGFNQPSDNRVLAPSAVVHLDRTQYRVIPVFERDDVVLVGIVRRGVGLVP